MEARASAKYLRGSAQKARLVVDMIRGKRVGEALAILRFTNKRAAEGIEKCLRSAIANARPTARRRRRRSALRRRRPRLRKRRRNESRGQGLGAGDGRKKSPRPLAPTPGPFASAASKTLGEDCGSESSSIRLPPRLQQGLA